MSILEAIDYIRIDSELHVQPFFKEASVLLTQWVRQDESPRDGRLSRKSMLKNVPAYSQSRKELYSSVFEEKHEHRFFLKKEFIQPILYGAHCFLNIHQYSLTKCYWKIFPYHLCLY